MKCISKLNNWEAIESTLDTQNKIMEEIDIIFSYWNRVPELWVAVNEISNKAYLLI